MWTLCPNSYGMPYGIPPQEGSGTSLNLARLVGNTDLGVALHISDAGYVAGWLGSDTLFDDGATNGEFGAEGDMGNHYPFVWNLNDFAPPQIDGCGTTTGFRIGGEVAGEARAVNDVNYVPTFAGVKYEFVGDPGTNQWTAFTWAYDPQSTTLTFLPLAAGDPSAKANAILDPSGTPASTRVFGKVVGPEPGFPACMDAPPLGRTGDNAARWTATGSTASVLQYAEAAEPGAWATGIHAADSLGRSAGYIGNQPDGDCILSTMFWEADGTPLPLGIGSIATHETVALGAVADTSTGSSLVVGRDLTLVDGLIWWRDGANPSGGFAVIRGSELCVGGALPSGNFVKFSAVNEAGWIVGLHTFSGAEDHQGFVLVPGFCPMDLIDSNNLNHEIGAEDLAFLLGAWGPCASACCIADINEDGVVDATDLALLLGAWGPCDFDELCSLLTPCGDNALAFALNASTQGSEAALPRDPDESLAILLAAFGQPSGDTFQAWFDGLSDEGRASALAAVDALFGGGE